MDVFTLEQPLYTVSSCWDTLLGFCTHYSKRERFQHTHFVLEHMLQNMDGFVGMKQFSTYHMCAVPSLSDEEPKKSKHIEHMCFVIEYFVFLL